MTPALSLVGLTKRYRSVAAVDSVSLDVDEGEFVALLGPSGSGKTTILRLLVGFDVPTEGQILIGGRDVTGLPPAERKIGMVFQHYALFPHMSVRRNIEYGLKMHGWPAKERQARSTELLSMVRLDAVGERMPSQLSGGQQQRIAIARALAYSPSILLMDEPLGALDRTLRFEMAEEIRRIHRSLRTTFIYVTHDRDEAMTLADRVLIMHAGQIEADNTPESLFKNPGTPFVAKFFAGMNVCEEVELGGQGRRKFAISPHAVHFTPPESAHFALSGTVTDRLFLGDKVQFAISLPGVVNPLIAHLATDAARDVRSGASVTAYVRRADLVELRE